MQFNKLYPYTIKTREYSTRIGLSLQDGGSGGTFNQYSISSSAPGFAIPMLCLELGFGPPRSTLTFIKMAYYKTWNNFIQPYILFSSQK